MTRTKLVAVLAALLLFTAGAFGALAMGIGPAPGGSSSGDDIEHFPTETPSDGSGSSSGDGGSGTGDGSGSGDGGTQATSSPPFTFAIDRIENCGTTCRDVTVTLNNEQSTSASDVTVYTRIYAGNTTDEDAIVWQGKEAVGAMDANSSVTRTQRVSLTYGEAYTVQQHDGWITVVTTVQSANETVTFQERRDVA